MEWIDLAGDEFLEGWAEDCLEAGAEGSWSFSSVFLFKVSIVVLSSLFISCICMSALADLLKTRGESDLWQGLVQFKNQL